AVDIDKLNTDFKDDVVVTLVVDTQAPTITSSVAQNVAENTGANALVATLTADETGTFTGLSGTDAAKFDLATNGELTLKTGQNFEASQKSFSISVQFTDTAGNNTTQAVTVNLTNVNEAPTVATEIADSIAVKDQPFTLNISSNFTDPDASETLTYRITSGTLPAGLTLDASTGVFSGTATTDADPVDITVTATDAGGLTVTDTFKITVLSKPVIGSVTAEKASVKGNEQVVFILTMSEDVVVTNGDKFKIIFKIGGTNTEATYTAGTGSNTLKFTATAPATGDGAAAIESITLGTGTGAATVMGKATGQAMLITQVGQPVTGFALDNTVPAALTMALDADTG
ncbi:MAG: hypothetical protein FE834_06910, partial [Gammaproteobacteria bacterium]|nr:hypothetical protein [Gammaproteobacteria bacterium]